MKSLLFTLLILLNVNVYSQHIHFVKFIHVGSEQHPIGTIVISVEKPIKPSDHMFDDKYGRSIQTDIQTFTATENFIKSSKLVSSSLNEKERNFKIVDFEGNVLYISYNNTIKFAEKLQAFLKTKKSDQKVISAFNVDFY